MYIVKSKSQKSITNLKNNINKLSKYNKANAYMGKVKTSYNNYKSNIYLYQNYTNYINRSRTINNYTITRPNFFIKKNINNTTNIKTNSYNKSNTIDLNSKYNLVQTTNTSKIYNKSKEKTISYLNLKEKKKNFDDLNKILFFDYKNNKDLGQLNKINLNISGNFFRREIPKYNINNRFNKNYNTINIIKRKNHFNKRKSILQKEKIFLNDMLKIYNKYNKIKKKNSKDDYGKIILWINDLINKKEAKNMKSNKYENFCKQLMKENNINDFSSFQSFAKNYIKDNINEEKSMNFFFRDIKNILFKEIA